MVWWETEKLPQLKYTANSRNLVLYKLISLSYGKF